MLLKSCHISAFGKLSNFSYTFSEGLNVFLEQNGWGKSTFAAFLRAMFYGLPSAGSRTKLSEAERRKYLPWQAGEFGGSLVFEVDGKEYRAERSFGKREAEDTFSLVDLSTNRPTTAFSSELGRELFGLDRDAFSRTTYLPQNRISDIGLNDSISAKLGRIAEGEEDSVSYERAVKVLTELRKSYVPDRGKDEKGKLAELSRLLYETEREIQACNEAASTAQVYVEKQAELQGLREGILAEQEICRKALHEASQYEALLAKKQHYESIRRKEEILRLQRDTLAEGFFGKVPEQDVLQQEARHAEEAAVFLGEMKSYRLNEGEEARYTELSRTFARGMEGVEDISGFLALEQESSAKAEELRKKELEARQREAYLRQKSTTWRVACIISLVGALAFLAFGFVNVVFFVLAGAMACASVVLILRAQKRSKELSVATSSLEELGQQQMKLQKTLQPGRDFLYRWTGTMPEESSIVLELFALQKQAEEYGRLLARRQKLTECEEKRRQLLSGGRALLEYYRRDGNDVQTGLRVLEAQRVEYEKLSKEYAELKAQREAFEQETSPERLMLLAEPAQSREYLEAQDRELRKKDAGLADAERETRSRAEQLLTRAENLPLHEEKRLAIETDIETKKREHFLVTETLQLLEKAKEQFSTRYMKRLRQSFERYLALLTGGAGGAAEEKLDAHVSTELDVEVMAYGKGKELAYFSTGLKDLIAIVMRFALVDTLFEEEEPFLILDDPFVNLDATKQGYAMNVMKQTARKYQIIYFACHESRNVTGIGQSEE